MAGMWILTVIVFTSACWIQVIIGSCPLGTFGDSCSYTCHCGQSCHQTTGVCGGVCDGGWVGGNGGTCQKENVALGRHASSPTRLWSSAWSADKAVDGNSNQDVQKNSCFNSADYVRSSWTVDLGDDYRIHDVRIYHQKNHLPRIRTAALHLSNTSKTPCAPCYTFPSNTSVTGNGIYDVVCGGIGRYFTITDPTHLNLCEVEIYVCSPGVFGDSCNQFCHCLQAACDPVSGVCPGDCRPGWQGDRCDTECDADYYGVNCMDICTNRKCSDVNSSCDRYNGSCDKGCLPGWRGVDCTQECNNGTYGANCNMTCSERKCAGDSSCGHVRGTCTSGCVSGWKGEDCTLACDSQHYGANCTKTCAIRHCVGNSSCNSRGDCDRGCETGWTLNDCTECSNRTYGQNCSETCSERKCAGDSSCDHVIGKCVSECVSGWMGEDCKKECDSQHYGPNCIKTCASRHCEGNSSCNSTGDCDMGCETGWTLDDCTACDSQHYGVSCDKTCASRHCVGKSSCNSTGHCDKRCETGWTLDDCTASLPQQNNPVGGEEILIPAVTVTTIVVLVVAGAAVGVFIWRRRRRPSLQESDFHDYYNTSHLSKVQTKQSRDNDETQLEEQTYDGLSAMSREIQGPGETYCTLKTEKPDLEGGASGEVTETTDRDIYEPTEPRTYETLDSTSRDIIGEYSEFGKIA
ncbi:protein draper-like [Haliotis cracherodii]|uniref:protein draper-like n=1 Tax=Haliotis cracherodii TaxID=6455 RepID=UPI0039EC881C